MANDIFNPGDDNENECDHHECSHFDEEVMEKFSNLIEKDINIILDENEEDVTGEMFTVLMSIAAEISTENGMPIEDFIDMAAHFHQDADEMTGEQIVEDSNNPQEGMLN